MKANISWKNYPDASFVEEYVNNAGFLEWTNSQTNPPFGRFVSIDSWIEPSACGNGVDINFEMMLEMPEETYDLFIESIIDKGWYFADDDDLHASEPFFGRIDNIHLQCCVFEPNQDLRRQIEQRSKPDPF